MTVSEARYIQLALEDPEGNWELVDGCPRKRPFMTWEHGHIARELTFEWSPSTGDYDVTDKPADYQRRGDVDIWLTHPYERILTAWRRHADGSYSETVDRGGAVQPAFLPDVSIDLERLFT